MALRVIFGLLTSSRRYRSRRDGRAIKIKIRAGRTVQIVSMFWCSRRKRLVRVLKKSVDIIYPTRVVISTRTSIAWSWKKISCSISGEALSWKPRAFQDAISF